jgi:hypothetical protein
VPGDGPDRTSLGRHGSRPKQRMAPQLVRLLLRDVLASAAEIAGYSNARAFILRALSQAQMLRLP